MGLNYNKRGFKFKGNVYHCVSLVRWSLYKYKCLWDVGGKGWSL